MNHQKILIFLFFISTFCVAHKVPKTPNPSFLEEAPEEMAVQPEELASADPNDIVLEPVAVQSTSAFKSRYMREYVDDFLTHYRKLPDILKDARARKHVWMGLQKHAALTVKYLLKSDVERSFSPLNEGCFKMLLRHFYYKRYRTKIDGEAGIPIVEIIGALFDDLTSKHAGNVSLSNLNLSSLDGIDALLVIRNEMVPIRCLLLTNNNLTTVTIPPELNSLCALHLNDNPIKNIDLPPMYADEGFDLILPASTQLATNATKKLVEDNKWLSIHYR